MVNSITSDWQLAFRDETTLPRGGAHIRRVEVTPTQVMVTAITVGPRGATRQCNVVSFTFAEWAAITAEVERLKNA